MYHVGMKLKVNKDKDYVIAVVAPREKGNSYPIVRAGVIRCIDHLESLGSIANEKDEDGNWIMRTPKNKFIFIHDGVTSGALGHVIEVINKISGLLVHRGRQVQRHKVALDQLGHGPKAQHRWLDGVIKQYEPDLLLVLDDGHYPVARYAQQQAKQHGIATQTVVIPRAEEKQRVIDWSSMSMS